MKLNRYHNLLEATIDLRSRGYIDSFKLELEKLQCLRTTKNYAEGDMYIIEHHRFTDATDPADSSIIFVIECHDGVKGLVTSSYGVYYDLPLMEFIDKVRIKPSVNTN